jgi:hypothetical protein
MRNESRLRICALVDAIHMGNLRARFSLHFTVTVV